MNLERTSDPFVGIESRGPAYIRYRDNTGRRWEVFGTCTGKGSCGVGAQNPCPELDCPVTPELRCECPLEFKELLRCNPGTVW